MGVSTPAGPLIFNPVNHYHLQEANEHTPSASRLNNFTTINDHHFLHYQDMTKDPMAIEVSGLQSGGLGHEVPNPQPTPNIISTEMVDHMPTESVQGEQSPHHQPLCTKINHPNFTTPNSPSLSTVAQTDVNELQAQSSGIPALEVQPPAPTASDTPMTPSEIRPQIINPATNPDMIAPEELRKIFVEMAGSGFQALARSCPTLHSVVIRLLKGRTRGDIPPTTIPVAATSTSTGPTTRSSAAASHANVNGKGTQVNPARSQRRLRRRSSISASKISKLFL